MISARSRVYISIYSFLGLLAAGFAGPLAGADTVAYWRFESGAFESDSSGNGHDITTNTGGATQGAIPTDFLNPIPPATGIANTMAASLPGSGLFSASDDDAFTSNSMTIEALIRPESFSSSTAVIVSHFDSQADPPQRGWYLGVPTDHSLRLYLSNNGDDINISRSILSGGIEAGKSYYVAASYTVGEDIGPEGEDILWRIYLQNLTDNGPLHVYGTATDMSVPFTSINNVPGPLAIGSTSTLPDGTASFHGMVDEVRISDTMLDRTELLAYYSGIPLNLITEIRGKLSETEPGGMIDSLTINVGGKETKYLPKNMVPGTLTAFGGRLTGEDYIADIITPAGTTEAPASEDRAGLLGDFRADTGFVNLTSWAVIFDEDITNQGGPDIVFLDWGSADTVDITIAGTTMEDVNPTSTSMFDRDMNSCPRFLSDQTDVTTLAALLAATFTQGSNTSANNNAYGIDLSDYGFADGAKMTAGTEILFSGSTTIDPMGVYGLTVIPEPASLLLLLSCCGTAIFWRRCRR